MSEVTKGVFFVLNVKKTKQKEAKVLLCFGSLLPHVQNFVLSSAVSRESFDTFVKKKVWKQQTDKAKLEFLFFFSTLFATIL